MPGHPLSTLVHEVAEELDSDILAYFGDIEREGYEKVIEQAEAREDRRRPNVILFLTTRGGDPNAGYRIARTLQDIYCAGSKKPLVPDNTAKTGGTFSIFVNSVCKSAGTIMALGANRIYMTRSAEFGPIDVQLRKPDEVGERTSGLTPIQSLQFLETQSLSLFKRHFTRLRFDEDLVFSTKMAAELATNITVGLLSPIYQQIDPIRLAEVDRSLKISADYGERLKTDNLKAGALEKLIAGYPSHGFVIDAKEASDLFDDVQTPPPKLFELGERFRALSDGLVDGGSSFVYFLNDGPRNQAEPSDEQEPDHGSQASDGEGVRDSGGEEQATRDEDGHREAPGAEGGEGEGEGENQSPD